MKLRYRPANQLLKYAFYATALTSLAATPACHKRENPASTITPVYADDVKLVVQETQPGKFVIVSEILVPQPVRIIDDTLPESWWSSSNAEVNFLDGSRRDVSLKDIQDLLLESGNGEIKSAGYLGGNSNLLNVLIFSNLGFMAGRLNNAYYRGLEERNFRPDAFYLDSLRLRESRSNLRRISSNQSYRPVGSPTTSGGRTLAKRKAAPIRSKSGFFRFRSTYGGSSIS